MLVTWPMFATVLIKCPSDNLSSWVMYSYMRFILKGGSGKQGNSPSLSFNTRFIFLSPPFYALYTALCLATSTFFLTCLYKSMKLSIIDTWSNIWQDKDTLQKHFAFFIIWSFSYYQLGGWKFQHHW